MQQEVKWLQSRGKGKDQRKFQTLVIGQDFVKVKNNFPQLNPNDLAMFKPDSEPSHSIHYDDLNKEILGFCEHIFTNWLEDYRTYAE